LLGLDPSKLPLISPATELLGALTKEAARITGLRVGTPVAVGAGDFPVALLGAGVTSPGTGCDITAPKPNSRAQFFGLTNQHSAAHLYRAVMEGVAFASKRNIELMKSGGYRLDRMVTAAGGAKNRLWLEIKASIYNCPILVPSEPECGVLGCAMLAGLAAGLFTDLESAGSQQVRYEGEIAPNPAWSERYQKMQSLFDDLYQSSQKFWDRLEG
jgi:sugar (pentulose or hexulose) kinase